MAISNKLDPSVQELIIIELLGLSSGNISPSVLEAFVRFLTEYEARFGHLERTRFELELCDIQDGIQNLVHALLFSEPAPEGPEEALLMARLLALHKAKDGNPVVPRISCFDRLHKIGAIVQGWATSVDKAQETPQMGFFPGVF